MDVSVLSDDALYTDAVRGVSAYRREKTEKLRFAEDKYRSLGAELLLRYALRERGYTDTALAALSFSFGENGKPYLCGETASVHFSLSHAGNYALCVLSDTELGCDIEKIRDYREETAKRFFSPGEAEDICAAPSADERAQRFFRYWTLRESLLKARGCGFAGNTPALSFRPSPSGVTAEEDGKPLPYVFWESDALPGYRCAVCLYADHEAGDTLILPEKITVCTFPITGGETLSR